MSGGYSTAASFGEITTNAVPKPTDLSGYGVGVRALELTWTPPNIWVSGGQGTNRLAYSTNGITWTASTSGNSVITSTCRAVAYGNGLLVAGGTGGNNRLAYSTDGVNWTASTSGNSVFTDVCYAVAYANGRWIAGGSGTNQMAYSTDGMEWIADTSGNEIFTTYCISLVYANELWLAGGTGTNQMAYSTDGITWTASTSGNSVFTAGCLAVAYANGKWVAGGYGTNRLAYSADGITWTASTNGNSVITGDCTAVAYGNRWVAGGNGTNRLAYSTDGITWTVSTSGNAVFTTGCNAVAYANGRWVAGGFGTNQLAYSTDGITWTASANGNSLFTSACLAVAGYSPNITGFLLENGATSYTLGPTLRTKYISGLPVNTAQTYTLKTDISGVLSDPATVTVTTLPVPAPVRLVGGLTALTDINLAWTPPTTWVAVGEGIATSPDGLNWTNLNNTIFTGGSSYAVAWNGTYWLAVGNNNSGNVRASIAKSYDAIHWTDLAATGSNPFPGTGGVAFGIAWNGSYWVAVGNNTDNTVGISKSTDAITWTPSSNNPFIGGDGNGIAWNGSYWVAVGYNLDSSVCIAKSSDGLAWTNASNNPFSAVAGKGIAWNGSYWVAVGSNQNGTISIAKSSNGLDWTVATNNPFTGGFSVGIAWNGSYWVATGSSAAAPSVCMAKSTDGMTWTPSSNNPFSNGFGKGIAWNGSYWVAIGYIPGGAVSIATSTDGMNWNIPPNNPFIGSICVGIAAAVAPITGYRVSSGGTNYDVTSTSKHFSALTADTAYTYTVRTDISGSYSATRSFPEITTLSTVPPPINLFGRPGVSTANLEWTLAYPYLNVTGYRIQNGGTTYDVGPAKKTTITGLDISAAYSFTIKTDISGAYSSTANFGAVTTFTAPKPSGLASAARGFTSLSLSWVPPVAWVAAAAGGMLVSADGVTWANSTNNPFIAGTVYGIAWNGSYWLAVGGSATITISKSTDGMTWTASTDNPFSGGSGGTAVAWNGSYWVAVGRNSDRTVTITQSTNGMTWTNATNNPLSNGPSSLTYGIAWNGSYWLAVGNNDDYTLSIIKSTDGLDWTNATDNPFAGGGAYGIAWNGTYWVAVGQSTGSTVCIAKSTNGLDWTNSTNNPFSGVRASGIAYGNGLWVAVGSNTGSTVGIATSTDGMNWTAANNNPFLGTNGTSIAWNGSLWIAGGFTGGSGSFMATSTDGMNWTGVPNISQTVYAIAAGRSTNITGYRLQSGGTTYNIAPASSKLVGALTAGTSYTFTIQTDVSGDFSATATFAAASTLTVPPPKIFARPRVAPTNIQYYWNGHVMYVAGGIGTNQLAYSTDGITWTASASGNSVLTIQCYAVAYGNRWVAGGQGTNRLAYSADGITWTASTSGNSVLTSQCLAVAYGNGLWVAGGAGTNQLAYSTDGINWTGSTSGNSVITTQCYAVAYTNGVWVAGGEGTNEIAYSTDGITWTASTSGNSVLTSGCFAVAYANGLWVAGGEGTNQLAYSTDGINWTGSTSGNSVITTQCYAVAYGNGLWVAGGDGTNQIAYSTDGITWNASTSGNSIFTTACDALAYGNGLWVAGGFGTNTLAYSTDGINWTASTSGNSVFTSIVYAAAAGPIPATFRLSSVNPSLTYTTAGNTIDLSGVTTLTDYSFTIESDISGNYSAAVPFRTVRTSARPAAVATLTKSQSITNGQLSVTFSWTNPADYAWFYSYGLRTATGIIVHDGTTTYSTLSKTFSGLDPTIAYTFNIERGNDAGYSPTTSVTTTPVYFNPASVAGLNFWVDAADTAGNGSTVADGTVIGTWTDKSGTTNNGTAAAGATLSTDSVGRYLDFRGASWYNLAASSWIYNQYYTIFIVDKPRAYNYTYSLVGRQSASADSFYIQYADDGIRFSSQGDNTAFGAGFEIAGAPVNVWCFTNYGGKKAYYNKAVSGFQPSQNASYITNSLLAIGATQAGSYPYYGRMREVLMYNGVMAETDREAIQNYLFDKWMPKASMTSPPVQNGCVMWLDAADIGTFFQDLSGNTPVTANDDPIALWRDKSGIGNNMNIPDPAQYRANLATLGYPGLFASTKEMQTANYLISGDATLFLVGWTSEGVTDYFFQHDLSGNFGLRYEAEDLLSWGESATKNNNQFPYTSGRYLFYGTMRNGQIMAGTFITGGNIYTSYAIDTLTLTDIVSPIKLSLSDVGYYEVIYYNRALSATELQSNAAYLSAKWGMAVAAAPVPQLWLDSSDPYTVFENAGTLTIWKDRSGNGYDAVPQGSVGVSDGIVFNGSQYLRLPRSALPTGNYSYYAVAKFTGDSTIIHGGSKDVSGQLWVAATAEGIASSYNLFTWTALTTPLDSSLGIAWNGSYWMAVGYNPNGSGIIKSTDGITWTVSTDDPFTSYGGFGIAWNGTYWIAVGRNIDNTVSIVKSTDGMTWTNSTDNPFDGGQGMGIAWNGTYWVAVGYDTYATVCIATSTDGDTWTAATDNPFSGGNGNGIAWNGTYWVAVGYNTDATVCIAKSTDGDTWTASTDNPFSGGGGAGFGIAWNGTYWVAVGAKSDYSVCIAKSTDGDTWTASTNNPFDGPAYGIAWFGTYWVAVGSSTAGSMATSTDGMTWTSITSSPNIAVTSIAMGIAPLHNTIMNIKTVTQTMYVAGGSGTNVLAYSTNGITWTAITFPADLGNAVAYGNGKWVAGFTNNFNRLAYSTDGISWTTSASGNSVFTTYCSSVAYANGLWLAGGVGSNQMAYSTDGITWTGSTSGNSVFTGACGAIAYANGLWVAGGIGTNQMAYSTDGITWTASTSGNSVITTACIAVAYGNRWVAGGSGTNQLAYSTDGITWTASANGNSVFTTYCSSVAYANGLWLAGGTGTNQMAYSTDGITWTASTSGNSVFADVCRAFTYANGRWVAGGSGTNQLAYSSDGINWTESTSGNSVITGGGIALASVGPAMYAQTSFDTGYFSVPSISSLTDSTAMPLDTPIQMSGWVATGGDAFGITSIVTSTDGMTWTPSTNNPFGGSGSGPYPVVGVGFGVTWNGSYWIAVGINTDQTVCIAKSTDGFIWSVPSNNPFSGGMGRGIAWNGSYWVAGGRNNDQTVCIAKSTNGMDWTDATNNPFSGREAFGIAWNGAYWVAVGQNAGYTVCIAKSSDGMTWTASTDNPFSGGNGYGIAWNGSYWVAVGSNGNNTVCIAKSTDGDTWTNATDNPFSGNYGSGIAWNGSYWVAVGRNSDATVCIAKSSNGMTWTASTNNPFSGRSASQVAWNGSYWVAVGANDTRVVCIAKSTDGMTWTAATNNPWTAATNGPSSGRSATGIAAGILSYSQTKTVIVESIYNGGKSLFLNGAVGPTDTSAHIQDISNNFIGWDLSGGYMNGTIKEILVYGEAHTAAQRQQVEQYLKAKWYPTSYAPSGAALWLDSTGLTLGRLATWPARAGSNFTQSIAWARPTYSVDAATGLRGVQFAADGTTTGFAGTPFTNTSSWCVFAVQRYDYSSDQDAELANGNICTTYEATGSANIVPGWVAVGTSASATIAISTDGLNWRPSTSNPFFNSFAYGIAWNGSYWIVVGTHVQDIVCIAKSTDGLIWTPSTNNPFYGGAGRGIAWNGTYWVAVGRNVDSTVCIAKSSDGMVWTNSTNNPFEGGSAWGIAWNGTYWIATGYGADNIVCIAKSTDGMIWTNSTNNPFSGGLGNGIAWNGTYWVAVGYDTDATVSIAKSTDGMTWTAATDNPFDGVGGNGIAWNGTYWVAVGASTDQSTSIAKSTDGMIWTASTNNPFSGGAGRGIAWNGSYWVAGGSSSGNIDCIAKSSDGETWTVSNNNPFVPSGGGWGIAYGSVNTAPHMSIGTASVAAPNTAELRMSMNGVANPATVEIHSKPVLTTQVVTSLNYKDFYNGNARQLGLTIPTALTTSAQLKLGYVGTLTPALAGAMRGYIYELIVYSRSVNTAERQAVEGYLAWKWGIQSSLPVTHPYFFAGP
jgi:hypothetical protein